MKKRAKMKNGPPAPGLESLDAVWYTVRPHLGKGVVMKWSRKRGRYKVLFPKAKTCDGKAYPMYVPPEMLSVLPPGKRSR